MIPWTVGQQYTDTEFAKLAGGRIVRIATHPDYQGMGYGARALHLLKQYYEKKIPSLEEEISVQEEIETVDNDTVGKYIKVSLKLCTNDLILRIYRSPRGNN